MFDYARGRSVPARLAVEFDPDPAVAVSCQTGCDQADPPFQWSVQGTTRVQETSGLGGSVNAIEIYSPEMPVDAG